ncbi:MAG: hypothetical protein E4H01_14630 [Lysobacterales bacterium]|nr:MAG: hypothetical protein E4H01_14630 [Xanthomonadales bacterium]
MTDHWDSHPIEKTCYCITCKKWFHYLGIARHRTMHRDRGENCRIRYTNGSTYSHPIPEVKSW